mgnify:CR=1 FL=1
MISVSETRKWIKEKAKKEETIERLLQLKYRINDTAKEEGNWSTDMSDHKKWVQTLINDVRKNDLTTIAREDMQLCNRLWKLYD